MDKLAKYRECVQSLLTRFDIKDEKIWLQQNLTDQNPAEELVAMGIPREDIILGLQPADKRQYTDYGVANMKDQTTGDSSQVQDLPNKEPLTDQQQANFVKRFRDSIQHQPPDSEFF